MSHVAQSTNDLDIPLEECLSELYNVDDKPFSLFPSRTFDSLPQRAQQLLSRHRLDFPASDSLPLTQETRDILFEKLSMARKAELSVFERNTSGVNREIVSQMSTLSSQSPGEYHKPQDEQALYYLTNVLIPEWRGHLDDGLDKIDTLIWFEMVLTNGTGFEQSLEVYLKDRREDVERMVTHATQSLQRVKEQLERDFESSFVHDCQSCTDVASVSSPSSASQLDTVQPYSSVTGSGYSYTRNHVLIRNPSNYVAALQNYSPVLFHSIN